MKYSHILNFYAIVIVKVKRRIVFEVQEPEEATLPDFIRQTSLDFSCKLAKSYVYLEPYVDSQN
jgi:hypothetical protein